jgi:hypothetical protein
MSTSDSIFFYATILPAILLLIFQLSRLHRMKKHDYVLYQFCQIRRDLIHILRDEQPDLSPLAYQRTKQALVVVNGLINQYDFCKVHIFNIRKLAVYFGGAARDAKGLERTGIAQIDSIVESVEKKIVTAFFVFTPFLRAEIVFKFFYFLLRIAFKLFGRVWVHLKDTQADLGFIPVLRSEGIRLGIVNSKGSFA